MKTLARSALVLAALGLMLGGTARAQIVPPMADGALGQPYLFTPPDVDTVNGAIGVCVRWQAEDTAHVTDVVIAEPSGDAQVDAEAPAMIRSIPWRVPDGYQGEWVGIGLSFTGAPPRADPDCEAFMKARDTSPQGPVI
jgi:hypothetical protein